MKLLGDDEISDDGEFIINMGPQHPSTHGVLHLKIWLNGETIKRVQPHLGYIHRSIEKMSESFRNTFLGTSTSVLVRFSGI
jgi:NADH-quinone oxidoreductase subunit D/NADH-quinone oxidoreductase subunit C/D